MSPLLKNCVPFFSRRSMAVCAIEGRLFFFGGVGAGGTEPILDVNNDCWIFDPSSLTWQEVARCSVGPSPRRCVGVAPTQNGMYLWGGSGITDSPRGARHTFLNDWWHFDINCNKWSLLHESDNHLAVPVEYVANTYPLPRYTSVFQASSGKIFLFGGYTEDRLGKRKLNDVWILNSGTWESIPALEITGYKNGASWPGIRYGCMSAEEDGCIYIFGGFSDEGDHNDLWSFDIASYRWQIIAQESSGQGVPAARYCAAFTCQEGKIYMFGGRSRRYPKLNFNDLWVFDLTKYKWECLSENRVPHLYDTSAIFPGYHAKSSSAVVDGYWYLWGGEGLHGHVSDFWRYSFVEHKWELIQAARSDDPHFW